MTSDLLRASLQTSEEFFTLFRSEAMDEGLIEHYGGVGSDEFDREHQYALSLVQESKNIWLTWAELENETNHRLILLLGFGSIPDYSRYESVHDLLDSKKRSMIYFYEKVVRHIRLIARIEAVSGLSFNPYWVSSYCRDIYPKLVNKMKEDPRIPPQDR